MFNKADKSTKSYFSTLFFTRNDLTFQPKHLLNVTFLLTKSAPCMPQMQNVTSKSNVKLIKKVNAICQPVPGGETLTSSGLWFTTCSSCDAPCEETLKSVPLAGSQQVRLDPITR